MSSSPSSSSSSERRAPELRPFHDVLCSIDIVLGTGSMTVRECLELGKHSVIRLIQPAGADLHVLVNGITVARGEVIVVDDTTSVRVTEIVPPAGEETQW